MAGTPTESEGRLMAYMVGWRKGAKGNLLNPGERAHEDVMAGFEAGQAAQGEAYNRACERYQARLSPLRSAATTEDYR